jgi:hypothetical protein
MVLNIAKSYVQTLSALSLYAAASTALEATAASAGGASGPPQPSPFIVFLGSFQEVRTLGLELKAIKCLLTAGYQTNTAIFFGKLVVFMIAPLAALVGVFLLMFANIYNNTRPGSAVRPERSTEDRLVVAQNRRFLTQERGSSDWRKVLARARNGAFAAALDATVLVLPQTISAMAQVQDCKPTPDGGYLIENPEVSCYDPLFLTYKNGALAIGYVW